MENRREILGSTFLFKGCQKAAESIKLLDIAVFEKGEVIYDRNCFKKCVGVFICGKAKAVPLEGTGVLSYFKTGDFFGAAALFGQGEEYISRVEAVTACKVQFIEEQTLKDLFKKFPVIAVNYIEFLSSRIRFLNEKLGILMQDGADARVYSYLIKNRNQQGISYSGKMTGLADTLCVGRTTLYRSLKSLEQKNLITNNNGVIKVIA